MLEEHPDANGSTKAGDANENADANGNSSDASGLVLDADGVGLICGYRIKNHNFLAFLIIYV